MAIGPKRSIDRPLPGPLSLERCLAKTWTSPEGSVLAGKTVLEHCCIVGEVARALIELYPAELQKEFFPHGAPLAAGVHDVGKVTPAFQERLHRAMGHAPNSLPELAMADPEHETIYNGHAGRAGAPLTLAEPVNTSRTSRAGTTAAPAITTRRTTTPPWAARPGTSSV
jgi:hypothetical protein